MVLMLHLAGSTASFHQGGQGVVGWRADQG